MKIIKTARNFVLGLGFYFALASGIQKISGVKESTKEFIQKNLDSLMLNQEKILGIKHFSKPNLKFELSKDDSVDVLRLNEFMYAGEYLDYNDTIGLSLGHSFLPFPLGITSDNNFKNLTGIISSLGFNFDVENTLYHELGHFYYDKLNESLGNGRYVHTNGKYYGTRLMQEGIAGYFENKINDEEDLFEDSDWPKDIKDFGDYEFYSGGYHLVKPIIEKFNKKGIEYLILNVPSDEELKDVPKYQKRVIKILSKRN